ncbi:KICSTOR complex protein SZT2 isoform X3 [Halyomorpha halys]|uniref:KICSTOR complex protein SZT2 isoform X3 n=1 Tax=Halyomorpha halys TaxID=286706 RepID=UPI0006D4F0AC
MNYSRNYNTGVLVAGVVYVYMNQNFHVSRNVRAQWFFKHLHKKLSFLPKDDLASQENEIEILSIYPQDPPPDWGPDTSSSYQYFITSSTNIVYLSKNNKAVYCLDLSPSLSAVDIQHGQVMLDEIISAVKNSIEGIVKRFVVPGTRLIFEPHLFVTVIVHTPFFTTPAQQVLVQGWRVTEANVEEFLAAIVKQLELLEDTIAEVSGLVHDEIENTQLKQAESERLVGGLFEEISEKPMSPCSVSMVGPDSGFINLLRYGMLALRLLPNCNLSNLIVVTDGMITLPDIHVLDSVLTQLRSNAVTVSFLHVGSQFHPHSCHGLVPYSELMEFIASATLGTYIHSPAATIKNDCYNFYHEAFITWCFRKKIMVQSIMKVKTGTWKISNQSFYGNREHQMLTKKQSEEHLIASLTSVLCCRLHEGYIIKNVLVREKELEITMVLPWSNHIFIEYVITSEWPISSFKNLVHYSLSVKAPYEFLHDITCLMKKPFHSPYRQAVVSRFWGTLKTLSHTDLLLSHLDSFSESPMAHTIPDSIKNGMPLFYLPSNVSPPELSSSGTSCPLFAQFWRPVVLLEPSVWQKWLHTHRLGLILQPDQPLPHSLHVLSINPRSQILQCRQAEATLYGALKKLTTFVLIENHSYIKIMPPTEGDKGPTWFFIVRVASKPPCAVIHIAFLGGTPGNLRHQVVEDIKEEIKNLRIAQRADSLRKYDLPLEAHLRSEVECCTLIQKPLEKILIRYERMPCEFGTVIFPDGTQPVSAAKPLKPASTLITTLSRYLHHKRSIWDAHTPLASHNNLLPTMLTTLTRMRLQEGFRFAHCTAGIINMVLEVQMKCYDEEELSENQGKFQPCIIQYILFPPHMTSASTKGSNSGDEMLDENESELRTELITECWIEPQHGVVNKSPVNRGYMEKLHYHQIADMIWRVDAECISNLLTFDHLQLMCHNQQITPPISLDPSSLHQNPLENWPHAVAIEDERIHRIPFAYNLMNLLPKCQQAELLSSMFIQELSDDWEGKNRNDSPNNLLMENFLLQLQELHHRDLTLSDHEATQLLELITSRPRDCSKRPIPFPTEHIKPETRKVSDAGSSETVETIPVANDWARLISWATYQAEISSSSPGSSDDTKNTKKSAKIPIWFNKKNRPQIPKWRCFVKSMASTHCVLTFIPASFHDLKMLMLKNEPKVYKPVDGSSSGEDQKTNKLVLQSNLNPEAEPFHPRNVMDSEKLQNSSSKSSSKSILETEQSEDDLVFESVSGMKETNKILDNPFRLRSSSWDPMKKQSEVSKLDFRRTRTSSVGARIKPWPFLKKSYDESDDLKISHNSVLGALTLPIYIYDCPLTNLVDALIFKTSFERRPDIYQDRTNKSEKGLQSENPLFAKSETDTTPDELDLHHHCKVVLQAFSKCFVVALFKSLHLSHKINTLDIQTAVDECEETLLEIDITKYIQTICGHYKQMLTESNKCKNLPVLLSQHCQSNELIPLHKLIRQRFLEILTVCFKAIPSTPEYYFCCPTQLSRLVVENQEYDNITLQSDVIEFSSNQNSSIGVWDRIGFESTFDDARTSLLSNMDSDSTSDSLYDVGDDLFPLFLHLVCSVRSQNKDFMLSNAVKVLPTCIGELFNESKLNEAAALDLSRATVTLDMYCLTLPAPYPADLPITESNQTSDTTGLVTSHCESQILGLNEQHYTCEDLKTIDRLQHLPFQQHKAISVCVTEIEWFLNDEIAVFLLDCLQVVESTLIFVANHVTNSIGRYSCILNTVHLNFVFGIKPSLEKFIEEFSQLKLPGYKLKKEGDFYYVIKDPNTSMPTKYYSFPTQPEMSTISSGEEIKVNETINTGTSIADARFEDWCFFPKNYSCSVSNKWIAELNDYRSEIPNFWLILKVDEEKVTSYFHCRFLEIHCEEVQHYKDVHSQVLNNVEAVCKAVNQTLLLRSLHETRMCDPLLEPETTDDIWKPNQLLVRTGEDGVDIDMRGSYTEVIQKFQPGWFSCPVVWQTHFLLHPRLKTGPGKPGLSRAIQALRTVLNRFSVNNRTNMFVYQDNHQNNVFYLRLHENTKYNAKVSGLEEDSSPGSVSRSSSINSLNNKRPTEDFSTKDIIPKLKSFDESSENSCPRNEDFLTLKVHGISPAGMEVKNELVQVLQNRLDDAVLEVVSVMLARNPMCKLTPDDVQFIQKPNSNPEDVIQITFPDYSYPYLGALSYYLKQNILQFLFSPKYIDTRCQFQDYSQPEGSQKRISDSNIFLYNQSPVSGNKGIACLAISLVDKSGNVISNKGFKNAPFEDLNISLDRENYEKLTKCQVLDSSDTELCPEVLLEIRLWKQGRINKEALINKLKNTLQYALWDLITEYYVFRTPIFEEYDDFVATSYILSKIFHILVPQWLRFGYELNVPAVKTHSIKLMSRHAVNITLKEINQLVAPQEHFTFICCENLERNRAELIIGGIDVPSSANCLLISGNISHWKKYSDGGVTNIFDMEPKNQKTNQKFSHLTFSSHDTRQITIPRQTFLIALINNYEVDLFMYNWSKDRVEFMTKLLTQLGQWLGSRSNFLTGIITQKLGIFHNQPYMRKSAAQINYPEGNDLDSLMTFAPSVSRKIGFNTLSNYTQILRDSEPVTLKKITTDPVCENINQIMSLKILDRREQQKKLRVMWQSRAATHIPMSEETLELFMRYSRIVHYCLTPLLFLPNWRLQSAATRDQTLIVNPPLQVYESNKRQEFDWHEKLCLVFLNEYKQYLQTLGFVNIQMAPSTPLQINRSVYNSGKGSKHFLQRSLLGGILMFELALCEPFFHVKLHALECSRIQGKSTPSLITQIVFNFLEEIDKMKVSMHLHSFAYDYHLRCLHSYISDQQSYLEADYHITSFLDDFLKYYPKAPNFARNLAYSGSLCVSDLSTPALQLFHYLLSHATDYEMEVKRMVFNEKMETDSSSSQECEYVLVKVGPAPVVTYRETHDIKHIDDLDMTLIITYDRSSRNIAIKLHYYIVLTTNRDLYPKLEMEWKLGKFCNVSTLSCLNAQINTNNTEALNSTETETSQLNNSTECIQDTEHLGIRQEAVNYLGYYSSHEQLMHGIVLEEATAARKNIESMIKKGSVDCRVHLLWNKLLSNSSSNPLSYIELFEMKDLAYIQSFLELDVRLSPMLTQPASWYQGLMKILMAKYSDRYKLFTSNDNNNQHLLILHPRFLDGFVMLSLDLNNNTGEINVIFRQPPASNCEAISEDIHSLVEGVINACCYHLWISLIT